MKQLLLFISGLITGVFATFIVVNIFGSAGQSSDGLVGLSLFEKKAECITEQGDLEIFQVLKSNMALAETGNYPDRIMVLLINNVGKSYYDDQKVKIPDNKCARHIGTYQYTTKIGIQKTVPAVVIE
jgi:hypothetical protein